MVCQEKNTAIHMDMPKCTQECSGNPQYKVSHEILHCLQVTLPFPLERRYLVLLLFDSQHQIKLFLVVVVNIPAVRHVLSLLQRLFQLMERWESMPKWDLTYVLTERVDPGKADSLGCTTCISTPL